MEVQIYSYYSTIRYCAIVASCIQIKYSGLQNNCVFQFCGLIFMTDVLSENHLSRKGENLLHYVIGKTRWHQHMLLMGIWEKIC